MEILPLIGRANELFTTDISRHSDKLKEIVSSSSFLVIGGAGSIGQAVCKEIFKRGPQKLHVVDISENNLVELVRDIRSSFGYIKGDFRTFAIDVGAVEYDAFIRAKSCEIDVSDFAGRRMVFNDASSSAVPRPVKKARGR